MSETKPKTRQKRRIRFDAEHFRAVYRELIEENPFAVRAVLKILSVEFTERVPTLAVTLEERPRLLVNLGFLAEHCRRGHGIHEEFVKAVICHEFLHILLRHTESFRTLTPERHLALDVVINAIIDRDLGPEYSGFMGRYYKRAKGVERLLRPPTEAEVPAYGPPNWEERPDSSFEKIWGSLYAGRLLADDIEEIARDLAAPEMVGIGCAEAASLPDPVLLGGHDPEISGPREGGEGSVPDALARALDRSLRSMNGSGVWRAPHGRGVGAAAYKSEFVAADTGVERWKGDTRKLLRRYLEPDACGPREEIEAAEYSLPVLSTSDRRAALMADWSPFLPNALWSTEVKVQSGTAQVYLDVSGSMHAEMPLIVGLLHGLHRYIRRPLWAFSDEVARAEIVNGRLVAETTGGTSMACVLEHVIKTRPSSAVVVSDGYIEELEPKRVEAASATRLHALVTRDGDGRALRSAGISFTQLGKVPQ